MARRLHLQGQARHVVGWRRDRPDHRDAAYRAPSPAAPTPPVLDLSPRCPEVRDQSWVGACVAFAAAAAKSFLYLREGLPDPIFSPLALYYDARDAEGVPSTEDSGCQIRDAMRVLRERGVCLEASWPFNPARYPEAPSARAREEALRFQSIFYYKLGDLQTIRRAIADGFPCVGGFSLPRSIASDQVTRTGIVRYPGAEEDLDGAHAVLFVGYDDQARLLKFQNSWGAGWGQEGFGFLDYRFVEDGLASDFWTLRRTEM